MANTPTPHPSTGTMRGARRLAPTGVKKFIVTVIITDHRTCNVVFACIFCIAKSFVVRVN